MTNAAIFTLGGFSIDIFFNLFEDVSQFHMNGDFADLFIDVGKKFFLVNTAIAALIQLLINSGGVKINASD
ncbi:MAG: hypothetical protein CVU42_02230 [Chloroflexi bacterium HGW-Chloroflexi-4]|nr:MAG: hypothetical protein CVU42_02230 [Chloroflexi bacterium HGW-Chloroflexi-4]